MSAQEEVDGGNRFAFGANWTRFLALLDENRIFAAEESLRRMLGASDLKSLRFLDIGCGSGLFSLAARRLGAKVHSFDFDLQSVECARELRRRYRPEDPDWQIEQGSVLDARYIEQLGTFDVVYSWGVLHHTGSMWVAIESAISKVALPGGKIFIAIYNDQGWKSHAWWFIKLTYNRLPKLLQRPFVLAISILVNFMVIVKYSIKLKPMTAIAPLLNDRRERGMSARYDAVDWIGGFPFEFAAFEVLEGYLRARGFSLTNSRKDTSQGCNELVAERVADLKRCAE